MTGQDVRVAVRVRQPEGGGGGGGGGGAADDNSCVRILPPKTVQVLPDVGAAASETCSANYVYGPDVGQADIYRYSPCCLSLPFSHIPTQLPARNS